MIFKDENKHDSGRLICKFDVNLIIEVRNPVKLRTTKHAKRME